MAQYSAFAKEYPVGTKLHELPGWSRVTGNYVIEAVDRTEADGTTVNRVWRITSGSSTSVFAYSGIAKSTQAETLMVTIRDGSAGSIYCGSLGDDDDDFYCSQERNGDSGRIVKILGGVSGRSCR